MGWECTVPPAELEALLISHPEVADAGVIGIMSEAEATELPRYDPSFSFYPSDTFFSSFCLVFGMLIVDTSSRGMRVLNRGRKPLKRLRPRLGIGFRPRSRSTSSFVVVSPTLFSGFELMMSDGLGWVGV